MTAFLHGIGCDWPVELNTRRAKIHRSKENKLCGKLIRYDRQEEEEATVSYSETPLRKIFYTLAAIDRFRNKK